ncbi:dihydropteroate synthase [Chlorobium sp.]|uniref:dihydropteroate synthase n=1 Tax=Chlorobium sp. TaxID=1095 RepID=UPI002F3F2A83
MKHSGQEHYLLDCRDTMLDLRKSPAVMGIVNLTPDSFSDGGKFGDQAGLPDIDLAVEHALQMVREGAAIIDIGGESTRPGAERIAAVDEIRRTLPVIARLRKQTDVLISIDTYKAEVAEAALKAGAQIVNDISGFNFDPLLPAVCRKHRAAAVLMHTPVTPQAMKWSQETTSTENDVTATVMECLKEAAIRARNAGVESIVLDPGFGFGKSVDENFMLLGNLSRLRKLGYPILAGVSRKSFLGEAIRKNGKTPPPEERHEATTAAQTIALLNGASIIRAHDVRAATQALAVVETMKHSHL